MTSLNAVQSSILYYVMIAIHGCNYLVGYNYAHIFKMHCVANGCLERLHVANTTLFCHVVHLTVLRCIEICDL